MQAKFTNCKFLSTEVGSATSFQQSAALESSKKTYLASYNHDTTQYKYYIYKVNGVLTDNTTQAMTGQAGACLVMDPYSATASQTLNWEFYIPVTAATDPQLKFYVKSSVDTDPNLYIDVYDSHDDATLLVNATEIPLTTTWTQYSVAALSPTNSGLCRVVLKALDDATGQYIGIDTMTFVVGSVTYTFDFTTLSGAGAAAGGAQIIIISG
jgi:hypothetical protein